MTNLSDELFMSAQEGRRTEQIAEKESPPCQQFSYNAKDNL